jgi:hypothetical protein
MVEEDENKDSRPEAGVRLSGRKHAKVQDLTRGILLEYAKRQGAVTEVEDLLSVAVQTMNEWEAQSWR